MKVQARLNNYQYGSYAFECLKSHVVEIEKLDRYHKRVTWVFENEYTTNMLDGEKICISTAKMKYKQLVTALGGYESRVKILQE